MNFTSVNRLQRILTGRGEDALTNNAVTRRDLAQWVAPISARIEAYMNRAVALTAYTEYFDAGYGQVEYFIQAAPITTLTDVYLDPTGEFDGGESEFTDCHIGTHDRSVVLPIALDTTGRRALRIRYTGGLAATGVLSTYAIATSAGVWSVGKFVVGSSSYACGLITAASPTSITVEVLYGTFEVGETLTEQDTEAAVGSSTGVATLTSKTITALCEAYPDITAATEMQIRYMLTHKHDFENSGTSKDGTTTRDNVGTAYVPQAPLRPEVMQMLTNYKRVSV